MSLRAISFLFLAWKSIDLLVSLIGPKFIPYLGFFSYGSSMLQYHLPDFIRSLSNFDGIFYIRIGLNGYSQYEQAYFPFYPLLIRHITLLTFGNPIFAGLLISLASFFFALIIFSLLLKSELRKRQRLWFFLFLLAYPTSFFFGVMYTESVFLLLFVLALYFFKKKQFLLSSLFAYLTGITRIVGVLLIIPLFLLLRQKNKKERWSRYLAALSPILGLATYAFFLWKTTGDPLYFFHAQEFFGAQRSTNLILLPQVIFRYLKIFLTASPNLQYFVAVLELSFLVFALTLLVVDLKKIWQRKRNNSIRLGLNLFSFSNLLIPTMTGTLTAIPRYSLLSLSIFFVLAEIKSKYIKIALMTVFIMVHIILLALFLQGYYVT